MYVINKFVTPLFIIYVCIINKFFLRRYYSVKNKQQINKNKNVIYIWNYSIKYKIFISLIKNPPGVLHLSEIC